jgi:hypothetical protein
MDNKQLGRGDEVAVRAYRGEVLRRRVWADTGRGVLLCSESSFQKAMQSGEEPLYSGFPKEDVVRVERSEDG